MAQNGVKWAGPVAGKCETIARTGFQASWSDATLCSRCAGRTVYAIMFSEANGQHLGPRLRVLDLHGTRDFDDAGLKAVAAHCANLVDHFTPRRFERNGVPPFLSHSSPSDPISL